MKKQIKYAVFALCAALPLVSACEFDPTKGDITLPVQTLALTAVSEEISLETTTSLSELLMTFEWTEARPVSDDYIVTCTTELDIVGNNFGSTTRILNEEDEGIFSRTFTYEQINNWANDRWKVPINTPFRLEFRVTVSYENGPGFESPEVDVKTVNVTPVKVIIFEADHMYLDGSAVGEKTEVFRTLENNNVFAWVGDLTAGELSIPVELGSMTTYVVPMDGEGTLEDGTAETVEMSEDSMSWNILTPGKYRIVVNMVDQVVTIYSPATDLQPKVVKWVGDTNDEHPAPTPENPENYETTVTNLWMMGDINNWGTPINMNCSVSLADPQILVSTIAVPNSKWTRFMVWGGNDNNKNRAYAFTCELTPDNLRQKLDLTLEKITPMSEGYTTEYRESGFRLPAGTNFIVLDLRNLTIYAEAR